MRIVDALLPGRLSLTILAERIGVTKPSLLRRLRALEEEGVVRQIMVPTETGRESFYELLPVSLHLEIKPQAQAAISWATTGFVHPVFPLSAQVEDEESRREVCGLLGGLEAGLDDTWHEVFVVLFGSVARGEQTWKSDIDLLLVGGPEFTKPQKERVLQTFAVLTSELKHAPRCHFTNRSDFLAGRRTLDREAAEDGLVMHDPWGDDDLWRVMKRYKRTAI